MSKYGYIEVFQSPLAFEITRVDCILMGGQKGIVCLLSVKGTTLQRKEFASFRSIFFPFRDDSFRKYHVVQGKNVTKLSPV